MIDTTALYSEVVAWEAIHSAKPPFIRMSKADRDMFASSIQANERYYAESGPERGSDEFVEKIHGAIVVIDDSLDSPVFSDARE